MITAKKSKAWIVLVALAVFFLLLGVLVGDEALGMMVVLFIVFLVIGLIVYAVSSRNYKKKEAWIANANKDGTIDRINNSIAGGSATYLKSLKLVLTPTEIVENSNNPFIIKYEDIANVYRSNVREGKYDYTYQYIRMDLKSGHSVYVATVPRAKVPAEFGAAIGNIKNHLAAEGGF